METAEQTQSSTTSSSKSASGSTDTSSESKSTKKKKTKTRDYGELCMALIDEGADGVRTFTVPPDQPEFSRIREVEDYIKEAAKSSDQGSFHAAVLRIKREYKVTTEVKTTVSFDDMS